MSDDIHKEIEAALDEALKEKQRNKDFIKGAGPAVLDMLKPTLDAHTASTKEAMKGVVDAISNITVNHKPITLETSKLEKALTQSFKHDPIILETSNLEKIFTKALKAFKVRSPIVNIPDVIVPPIQIPRIEMPKNLKVLLDGIDRKNPLPVMMVDLDGKPYFPSYHGGGGGAPIFNYDILDVRGKAIADGTTTVTIAGTPVRITAISIPCKRVIIQAHESNTGTIVVGSGSVVAALVGRRGWAMYATNSQEFKISDVSLLFIDSTVGGDKINYYYEI